MKLIGAITSPYVRKVRIVMAEKKLDYQFLLPTDVWSADTTDCRNPTRWARCPAWSWKGAKPCSTRA
jgi:glutathione S-transferase